MSQFVWFKVLFGNKLYEWSEKHYLTFPTTPNSQQAKQAAAKYASARVMLFGAGVTLDRIELGDDLEPQNTTYVTNPQAFTPGFAAPGGPIQPPPGPPGVSKPPTLILPPFQPPGVNKPLGGGDLIPGINVPAPAQQPRVIPPLIGGPTSSPVDGSFISFAAPPGGAAFNPELGPEAEDVGPVNPIADFPYSTLLIRKEAAVGPIVYHAPLYLSGNPDFVQIPTSDRPQDPVWWFSWGSLRITLGLQASNYGMKVLLRSGPQNQLANVLGVTVDLNNHWVFIIDQLAPPIGSQVQISGVKGNIPSQVNGHRYVSSVTGAQDFGVAVPPVPPGWFWKGGGQVLLRQYQVVPYTRWFIRSFTHRKRGDSQAGIRGRKHAPRSLST